MPEVTSADVWMAILGEEHGVKIGLMIDLFGQVPDEVFADALDRLNRLEGVGPMLDPSAWLTGARADNTRVMRDVVAAARQLAATERTRVSNWREDVPAIFPVETWHDADRARDLISAHRAADPSSRIGQVVTLMEARLDGFLDGQEDF